MLRRSVSLLYRQQHHLFSGHLILSVYQPFSDAPLFEERYQVMLCTVAELHVMLP